LVYLGHVVGCVQVAVPRNRAEGMASYIRLNMKKGMRSFLGSINYNKNFTPKVANLTALLTPATAKQAPGRVQ